MGVAPLKNETPDDTTDAAYSPSDQQSTDHPVSDIAPSNRRRDTLPAPPPDDPDENAEHDEDDDTLSEASAATANATIPAPPPTGDE